jgi:phage terminase large subunit-like protein
MSSSVYFNPDPELYPDPSGRAKRICKFISNLKIWEGDFAGENFKIQPFQEAMIRRIYGPNDENGDRLARIVNIWVPRGNGKTSIAAALGLAHFMGPEAEAGGQVICAAADRGNAGIAFNHSWQMIQIDPQLFKRVSPIISQKEMRHNKTQSLLKAISTESYSKHGLNVSFFLADELHAWPATEARKLWKVITDSMVKRTNPLTVMISTAGEGTGGLAWDMWEYSHQVARGEVSDPSFIPIIFAAEEDDNWKDEATWYKANPLLATDLGGSLIKELRNKITRTQFFPTDAADFKRFHLNLWIEGSATPWIEMVEVYDKCDERTDIELIKDQNRQGFIGVDLSSVEDLTCVSMVFPDDEETERGFDIFPMFFLPEDNLQKKSDQKVIMDYVIKLYKDFNISEVAVDRWNSTAFVTGLQDKGVEVIEFGQGFVSMAGPVKEIKATLLSGKFRHGNNLGLRSSFSNVVTEKDSAENEKFTKSKARGRIDGATATAQAIGRILDHEQKSLKKQYRGFFSRKESVEKIYAVKEEEIIDDGSWNPEVLKDLSHPDFDLHRRRFEKWSRQRERMDAF